MLINKYNSNDFIPILRIRLNIVRSMILISPKILVDLELFENNKEKGNYLRSYYGEEKE